MFRLTIDVGSLLKFIPFMEGDVNPATKVIGNHNKFWEELIAYFPLVRHGQKRKQKIGGDTAQTAR
jgi:hypothetical protein